MDRCEAGVEEDGACRARKRGTGGVGSERREGGRGCEAKVDAKHNLKDLPSTILNTGTFISPSFHPSLPFEFPCCPPFPFPPSPSRSPQRSGRSDGNGPAAAHHQGRAWHDVTHDRDHIHGGIHMRRRRDTVTGGMRGAAGPKDDIMSMEAHIRGEHEAAGLANKDVMNLSQARWHPWTWAIHRAVRATRIVTDHKGCASGRGLRRVMRGHDKLVSTFVATLSVAKRLELCFNWFQGERWEQCLELGLEPLHDSRTLYK